MDLCGYNADLTPQYVEGRAALTYFAYDSTCPRQEISENTNREFVIPTEFLPYILRTHVLRNFLPGTSNFCCAGDIPSTGSSADIAL